jgi:ankyrin repeat protein
VAFLHGHEPVARLLLEQGFEPDLVEAAMIPDWPRVEALLDAAPALVNAPHPAGGTALWAAARMGRSGFWRLQSRGADPDARPLGRRGQTPAGGALSCPDPNRAHRAAIELLSNAGSPHARQPHGDTLLHLAGRRGDEYLVRYLLRRGAEPSAHNERGETPLDVARASGHDVVAATLRAEATIPRDHLRLRYAYDASGGAVDFLELWDVPKALQGQVTGSSHNEAERVQRFLEDDARLVFSISSQDELAVEACGHTGNHEIMRMHLDRGAPQSLATSLSLGDLARAKELLAEDPLVIHERGPHDFPMMWYASIGGGGVEAAELLLAHGADVDQETLHTTALHRAARSGQTELACFLVERGADVRARGQLPWAQGLTPAETARLGGSEATARALEELGG